jgi:hypothetical protein
MLALLQALKQSATGRDGGFAISLQQKQAWRDSCLRRNDGEEKVMRGKNE